jgi:hypothetical protein
VIPSILGTWAAWIHAIIENVAASSTFALFQSAAAGATVTIINVAVQVVGVAVAVAGAGAVIAGLT